MQGTFSHCILIWKCLGTFWPWDFLLARVPGSCRPLHFSYSWDPRLLGDLSVYLRWRDFDHSRITPEEPESLLATSCPSCWCPRKPSCQQFTALQCFGNNYGPYTIVTCWKPRTYQLGSEQNQAFHFWGMSPSHAWDFYMPLASNTGITPGRHLLHRRPFKWGQYLHPGFKLLLDRSCAVEYTALVEPYFSNAATIDTCWHPLCIT